VNGFGTLRRLGVLALNRRNARYTLGRNPRRLYPLVDDKLRTKALLEEHGLPAPALYFRIDHNFEIPKIRQIETFKDFVVKPARGAEGRGILVIADREGDRWKKSSGEVLTTADIEYHVSNILAGLYSLGGIDDRAFVEYRVRCHAALAKHAFRGVPDVRVILYRGVPVMSMLRLPTRGSDGRANLHQGAVGCGLDMARGETTGGVLKDRWIGRHPDTGLPVAGIRIPFWKDILATAVRTYDVFGLGYMGADFVVDHLLGPLILELNARPGLNIQLANHKGLLPVLDAVDARGRGVEHFSAAERLELALNLVR
jgi:alpha-L-glutamate ligase-like protein